MFLRDAKVVGISQRRTREWIRLQCAVSIRWDADTMAAVVSDDSITASSLRGLGADLDLDAERVGSELVARVVADLDDH